MCGVKSMSPGEMILSGCRSAEHRDGSLPEGGSVRHQPGAGQHQLRADPGGGALRQRAAGRPEAQRVHFCES